MVREATVRLSLTSGRAWFKTADDFPDDGKVERTEKNQLKIYLDGNSHPDELIQMQSLDMQTGFGQTTQTTPTQAPKNDPVREYPLNKLRVVLGNDLKYICNYLNILLERSVLARTYVPIKEEELLFKLEDGVLLCAMANYLKPNYVDEQAVFLHPRSPVQTAQNINLGLVSLSTLGVFVGEMDAESIYLEGTLNLIVIILQWLRLATVGGINLRDKPYLVSILDNSADQTEIDAMLSMPPEEVLYRWVNYQLKKPHGENQTQNTTALEYARLLNAVAPAELKAAMISVEQIIREKNVTKQAEMVVKNAETLSMPNVIAPEHIIDDGKGADDSGRARRCRILRSVFLARTFMLFPSIQDPPNTNANKTANEYVKARIQNKKNEGGIEEILMLWLLSFGIGTPIICLDIELLQSGIVLLQVLDNMYPGCVDWVNVNAAYAEKSPKRKLYWCANCDLVMQIVRKHKMKVNCSGSDIRTGDKKKILNLVLVMMQRHMQLLRKITTGSGTTEIDDKDLTQWFNEEMKAHGSDFRINDINDVALRNTNAIGFFGERMLAEYRLSRFRLVIERERVDKGMPMHFEAVKPVPVGELEKFSRTTISLLRQGGVHVHSNKLGPGVDVLVYRYILLQLNVFAIKWKETGIRTKRQIRQSINLWIGLDMQKYTEEIAGKITFSPKTPKGVPSKEGIALQKKMKRPRKKKGNRRNKPKSKSTQKTGTSTQKTATSTQKAMETSDTDSNQEDDSEWVPYDDHERIPEHVYSLPASSGNLKADICCICTHLNLQLARIDFAKAYLPLTEKNVFAKFEDGVLLCAMAIALKPGSVDTKFIAQPPCTPFQRTDNINLGLMSLSILGVPIGNIDADLIYHYGAAHLLELIIQWLLLITLDMLNLKRMPQLAYILEKWFYPDEMVNIQLMDRDSVLRLWVNYQLKNAGTELVMNENCHKKDDIMFYAHLLNAVAPLEKKISMTPIDAIVNVKDQKQQLEMVVKNAEALDLKGMIAQELFTYSQDAFKSWRNMTLRYAFLAQTCLLYPNISIPERKYTDLFTSPGDLIHPVKEGSIEDTLTMWLNSFLRGTQILCLATDLRNGLILLQVLASMYPDCVKWSNVNTKDEMMPKRKFNWTENCRLALDIATKHNIKVNCSSTDIVSGQTNNICNLVYTMMLRHTQILRQKTLGGETKEIDDKDLVSWFNDQMKEYNANFQILDMTDLSLKSCNAIGFLGERILYYNRFCRHCFFENDEEIISTSNSKSKSSSSDVDQNSDIEDPESMSNISKAVEHNSGRSVEVDQNSEIMKADSAYYVMSSSNAADSSTSIDNPDSVSNFKSNTVDHITVIEDPDSISKLTSIANLVDQTSDVDDPDTVSSLKSSSNVVNQISYIDELESNNAVKPNWQFESVKAGRGEELNAFSRTTIALLRQGGVQVYSSKLGPNVDILVYRSILLQLNTIASK